MSFADTGRALLAQYGYLAEAEDSVARCCAHTARRRPKVALFHRHPPDNERLRPRLQFAPGRVVDDYRTIRRSTLFEGKRSFRGTLTTVLPLIAFRRTRPVGSGCSGSGEVEGQQIVDISIDRALRQFGENVAQPCERLDA